MKCVLYAALLLGPVMLAASPDVEELLRSETGFVKLSPGNVVLHHSLTLAPGAHDLEVDARGVTLELATEFQGPAAVVITGGRNLHLSGLAIEGHRDRMTRAIGGIAAEKVSGLFLDDVTMRNLSGAAVVVRASERVRVHGAAVSDSVGGILIENAMRDFEVSACELRAIGSPGILVRAGTGARNSDGRILENKFTLMPRAAIQVSQTTRLLVEKNTGIRIGYPLDAVIGKAIPAAIQTAGGVDTAQYRENSFEEVNGKCVGLDGFRDGEVRGNSCVNQEDPETYPKGNYGIVMSRDTQNALVWGNRLDGFLYGAVLVEGSGHQISHNHFLHLNMAHCNVMPGCVQTASEPDLLRSGVYLHGGAGTRDNVVEANEITGFGMGVRCVVTGPGVSAAQNRIGRNDCTDDTPMSAQLMDR